MQISTKDWSRFTDRLSKMSSRAADDLRVWVNKNGGLAGIDRQALIDYVYALATKYGEGSAAWAASWYDAVAEAAGRFLPAAEVASTVSYAEAAKTVNGVLKTSTNEESLTSALERLVKMPGVDTTLNNAIRDGAEVAWIPRGDACAFCVALASRGWQRASARMLREGHAEHVHAHCDCTYAVRFDESSGVRGYDPSAYLDVYEAAGDGSPTDKINAIRREQYARDKDRINEQKRAAYAARKEAEGP